MSKLRTYIHLWIDGKNVKGVFVSPLDIHECIYIYNEICKDLKPTFINSKAKYVLDLCDIKTIPYGIGWRVA